MLEGGSRDAMGVEEVPTRRRDGPIDDATDGTQTTDCAIVTDCFDVREVLAARFITLGDCPSRASVWQEEDRPETPGRCGDAVDHAALKGHAADHARGIAGRK